MRTIILSGALLAALCGATVPACAEETTVIHRDGGPSASASTVTRAWSSSREVTTGSVDCGSKTVHKEDGWATPRQSTRKAAELHGPTPI